MPAFMPWNNSAQLPARLLLLAEAEFLGTGPLAGLSLVQGSAQTGRRTINTEPLPSSLAAVTSPPIMRASLRVMARPRPVPPKRCAVAASAWLNASNSFACCSAVMPMPVSTTASSIQSRPSTTLRARSLTSPCLVNLQALLSRLSRICRSRMGSTVRTPRFSWASTTRRFLFFSASCPAVPMTYLYGLWVELELSGLDLRQVEHLVNEAKEMNPSAVHALQRLLRLFRAEPRGVRDHHFGQPDDGIERRAQLVAHAGDELRLVLARPHVLDRDRRLVREGRDQLDLLVGERLNGAARQDQHAGRSALAQHRHAEDCAHVGEPGSYSQPYLRICFGVHDMNGLALEYDPAGDRTTIRPERMLFHVLLLLRGKAVARDMMVGAVLGEPDGSPIRAAKACRRLGERVEHRLQIEGRAADDLQHVGGDRLLL